MTVYLEEAYHHRGWIPYISGVRTLVIRLFKKSSQREWTIRRPPRGRHSPAFTMSCITWKVNSNLQKWSQKQRLTKLFWALVSVPSYTVFSRGQHFPQSAFCLDNKIDRPFEGTENDFKKASKVDIFGVTLEWLYSY